MLLKITFEYGGNMLELIVVLLVIGLDQLAKYLTQVNLMPLGTSYPLFGRASSISQSAHNTGAAFSMTCGRQMVFCSDRRHRGNRQSY
jgi:lipoprotein signal peptidase